jgi:hypothetical protein
VQLLNTLAEPQTQPAAATDLSHIARDSEIDDTSQTTLDSAFELLATSPVAFINL